MLNSSNTHVDWLKEVKREGGELAWIWRAKHFHVPHNAKSVDEINAAVLASHSVRVEITAEVRRRGDDSNAKAIVTKEAHQILAEMEHNFQLGVVRTVGYAVLKVIKQIFSSIYVNFFQLSTVREQCERNLSVVFMPTHKSYMDFLLISLLCFHADVPLPAICAGEDFRASALLGGILRRCGAFFIRRTFGNDRLYWAIFSEYVQLHIADILRPIEFFVEGQRSRTTKSLYPKTGLFQTILQPFFASKLFDLVLVPVTINYDKLLEENLYSRELLGIPKPKETASGLFKARDVLRENYGNIYVTFSEPVSVREYFAANSVVHSLRIQNSFLSASDFEWNNTIRGDIRRLAHRIIKIHNKHTVLTIWPLVCFVILKFYSIKSEILRVELAEEIYLLKTLFNRINVSVTILGSSIDDDLNYFCSLHKNLLQLNYESGIITWNLANTSVFDRLTRRIIFFNYSNSAVAQIFNVAIISTSIIRQNSNNNNSICIEQLFFDFMFLEQLFHREFIVVPNETQNTFNETLEVLHGTKILNHQNRENKYIQIIDLDVLILFANFIKPWLECYAILFRNCKKIIINNYSELNLGAVTNGEIVNQCRRQTLHLLEKHKLIFINNFKEKNSNIESSDLRISCLSTDTIKNVIDLFKENVLIKGDNKKATINFNKINELITKLDKFVPKFAAFLNEESSREIIIEKEKSKI